MFDEVPQMLYHVLPIEHRLDTLQTFVVPFMSVIVKFCKGSFSQRRICFEINAVLEIQQSIMITPRSHGLVLQNLANQLLQFHILLHLGLDWLHPMWHGLGDGLEVAFLLA